LAKSLIISFQYNIESVYFFYSNPVLKTNGTFFKGNTFSLTMLSYVCTYFHFEKDEATVPVQLSEKATEPHKGNSCLAAEELWKPTIVHNTVTFHGAVILSKFSALISSYFLKFRICWRKKNQAAELSAPSFKCVCVRACHWDGSRINNRVKQSSSFLRDEDSAKSQHD
jgi:hypothetical protein